VDDIANIGGSTSIALDTNGKAHISYCNLINSGGSQNYLKYATNAFGSWINETVDTTGTSTYVGGYGWLFTSNSIALNISGKVYISYKDVTNSDLKYAVQQ
jgi:hypothetical protein